MRDLTIRFGPEEPLEVLCLGSHSDDIEIGCAGTLLTLMEAHPNVSVQWVVFGAQGRREEEARVGAERVLKGAGQCQVDVWGFRDGYFPWEGAGLKEKLEEIKNRRDPDLVFTHYREDRHQDHRTISDLTWQTFRNHLILEYEVPKYDGDLGHPNLFVPITDPIREKKLELLETVFSSQGEKHWFSRSTFESLMRLRGMESSSPTGYAEGFFSRKSRVTFPPAGAGPS